ncbi:FKBP-type peptidyl-prolyl cis-trans isomerase [Larkinella terrae]|nr:FKBP-type peptidyl-prolyl cis-trans isomerase [Larkinella terrae]
MNSKLLSTVIALLIVAGLTSCLNKDLTDPSAGQAALNDQQIKDYLTANQLQDKVTASASGLYYIITGSSVTGRSAIGGDELEFTYKLSYIDAITKQAVLVDSANATKSAYIPFLPGVVVQGLEEGFLLLKEGQSGRFFMPSSIGFGNDTRSNKMPEYSAVIFDVTLKRSRTEKEQMDDYAAIKNLPAPIDTANSIRVYRTTAGTGSTIAAGNTVTVAYTANSLRGTTPFDKSDSLTFVAGSGQYIEGFSTGITRLKVGDKALLVFPSVRGYGVQGSYDQSKGYYVVPPYTPLAFEITVKSVKK